ncbi:MAG: threonyl-tRNA synthetase editing domain-containing protein [Acidiferrobacterales bacterium]
MKLLMFQARRFRFKTFLKTLADADDQDVEEDLADVAVIFVHSEPEDEERRDKVFATALKNTKWLANKRSLKGIVLHSFTHLSSSKAEPDFARTFLDDLAARLRSAGYEVWITPFGYTCEWDLSVHGDSIAKVFKAL